MRLKETYRWNLTGNLMRLWVEMKNRGLEIGEILGGLAY